MQKLNHLKHEHYEIANLKKIKPVKNKQEGKKLYVLLSCKHFKMILIDFMAVERVKLKAPAKKYFPRDTKFSLFFFFKYMLTTKNIIFFNI